MTTLPPVDRYVLFADERGRTVVTLERRGYFDADVWAIVARGAVLNKYLELEYEPSPSNREDDFLARARFTFTEALSLWRKVIEKPEDLLMLGKPMFVFKPE